MIYWGSLSAEYEERQAGCWERTKDASRMGKVLVDHFLKLSNDDFTKF